MTSQNTAETVLLFSARDEASSRVKNLGWNMESLGQQAESTARRMFGFTAIMGGVGIGVASAGMVVHKFITDIIQAHQAAAQLQTRMVLLGFSADTAARTMDSLRNSINLTTYQALGNMSEETVRFMAMVDDMTRTSLVDWAEKLAKVVGVPLAEALDAWREGMNNNLEPLRKLLPGVNDMGDAEDRVTHAMKTQSDAMGPLGKAWDDMQSSMVGFANAVGPAILGAMTIAMQIITATLDGSLFRQIIDGWTTGISLALSAAWEAIGSLWESLTSGLATTWATVWGGIIGGTGNILTGIGIAMGNAWSTISGWWTGALIGLHSAWSVIWAGIVGAAATVVNTVGSALRTAWEAVSAWWRDSALKGFMDELLKLPGQAFDIGKQIIEGLAAGIIATIQKVIDAARAAYDAIVGALGDLIGHSPSPLGISIGEDLASGMREGFGSMGAGSMAMPALSGAGMGGGAAGGGPTGDQTIHVSLEIGGERFAEAVVNALNDQVRMREPRLLMS